MLRQDYEFEAHRFKARDGTDLYARHFPANTNVTVLLLHGVGANSYLFNTSCGKIREAANAGIFALDLRGHGESGGRRGDVDYIGQYEDDVAEVIAEIRAKQPGGKLILAGHSMGGGIALRYAMKRGPSNVDGYLLFAPHLGFNSPTAYSSQPQTGNTGEPEVKMQVYRIIGLFMLNIFGIVGYNDLGIAFFNIPSDSPQSPVDVYSYRAFSSVAPTDYKSALSAVEKPLLVVVGSNDEAFSVEHFKPVLAENSDGRLLLFDGIGHNGIMYDNAVIAAVGAWIRSL
jgi:alpha-beta hydrolase superfamily lysophospholipase